MLLTLDKKLIDRLESMLTARKTHGLERVLCLWEEDTTLNLANNDYLELANDPRMKAAAQAAIETWGCSASASPLLTGYRPIHQQLEERVCTWSDFPEGLIWNTGYAANSAILSTLPQSGDLILADRLIHNSMISGILKSGARLIRYRHCDLNHLEDLLKQYTEKGRIIFVATETVFSMDGDYPDLSQMARLKEQYGFTWIVDEAHAIGWYGHKGSGLSQETNVTEQIDVLVGTFGKALGSMGAFTLFRDSTLRQYLLNYAEEFIYSTYLAPACAATSCKAIEIVEEKAKDRSQWHAQARDFRRSLQEALAVQVPDGNSPIIPVILGDNARTFAVANTLKDAGIAVAPIRPPVVPEGKSRLRLSIKSHFDADRQQRVLSALGKALRKPKNEDDLDLG